MFDLVVSGWKHWHAVTNFLFATGGVNSVLAELPVRASRKQGLTRGSICSQRMPAALRLELGCNEVSPRDATDAASQSPTVMRLHNRGRSIYRWIRGQPLQDQAMHAVNAQSSNGGSAAEP